MDRLDAGETMNTAIFSDMMKQICVQHDCDDCAVRRFCNGLHGEFFRANVIIQNYIIQDVLKHGTQKDRRIIKKYAGCEME